MSIITIAGGIVLAVVALYVAGVLCLIGMAVALPHLRKLAHKNQPAK
jgi:hypothetical protein